MKAESDERNLNEIISFIKELSYENQSLAIKVLKLKDELRQTRDMLIATRARNAELLNHDV